MSSSQPTTAQYDLSYTPVEIIIPVTIDSSGGQVSLWGEEPDFAPGTEDDQGKLDEKSPIECPHCQKFFTP